MCRVKENKSFLLKLNSHTNKKRLEESIDLLKSIYPFELTKENLYIEKTKEKDTYNVYISNINIKKKEKNIKLVIFIFLLITIILFVFFGIRVVSEKIDIENQEKIEIEKQNIQKIEYQKSLQLELANKKNKYEQLMENDFELIYPILENIYVCLKGNSKIENLSISKNTFSVDIKTDDSIEILRKFEQSKYFSSVKMNRTTTVNNKELVTFTGSYVNSFVEIRDDSSTEEKIEFYTNKISIINNEIEKQKTIPISNYIANIKRYLQKNNCEEQYIQLRGELTNIEVECSVLSESKDILNFIKEIQSIESPIYKIKEIKIRNTNKIQTNIIFATGIELIEDELVITNNGNAQNISSTEMSKLFYSNEMQMAKKEITQNVSIDNVKKENNYILDRKYLIYIGSVKVQNETKFIVKDEEMNVIYKLSLVKTFIEDDCCFNEKNKLIAKINNIFYEVKR